MSWCDALEPIAEAIADGSRELTPEQEAHFSTCEACRSRLAWAREIHTVLAARELPDPPALFTANVLARVRRERWQGEQAVDLGFNLTIAAGVLLIVGGLVGLAWSLGLLTFEVDARGLLASLANQWVDRVFQQLQTIVMATVLLTMALGLWWWAEGDRSY
ncbi:MAG: hypothetical protein ACRD2N_17545 [Vicinamibacterales bacterium]